MTTALARSANFACVRRLTTVLCLTAAICGLAGASQASALPPIKHVWIIQLENKSYDEAFVANQANQYLWRTLPKSGEVMREYYGTSHVSLGNYVTQISGQAPNVLTQSDCLLFVDVLPGILGTDGQAIGQGCVYPASVKTLPDQLEAKGLTWKGYMQDMGNDPARESATCGAPAINSQDHTQSATAKDQYASRHNPFIYFHSILDPPGRCQAHVVPLPPLADDLKSIATTPNFSWITPNLCDDGHDGTPCAGVNSKGTKEGSLIAADAFLAKWVPVIMASKAFQKDGLLLITFDESEVSDALSCCNQPIGFNTPLPGITGVGGGRTGAVALSPYVEAGSTTDTKYNHYSLLKSLEQIFGITDYLGYAKMPGLSSFGDDVYNRPEGGPVPLPGPLKPGDAGSTGTAETLKVRTRVSVPTRVDRMRSKLRHGLTVRVTVTGTDRAMNQVRVRFARAPKHKGDRAITLASSKPRTLRNGVGTITLKASKRMRSRIKAGRYLLIAESLHEDDIAARSSRSVVLKR